MRIAILNIIKPHEGSGEGTTEYAYRLYTELSKRHKVDLLYAIEKPRGGDVVGLIYTNSLFRNRVKELGSKDYDVIHIVNQELGFAARILRVLGTRSKIVTTVHDLERIEKTEHYRGLMQGVYNSLVSAGVRAALEYSDEILFTSTAAEAAALGLKKPRRYKTITLAPRDGFATKPIPSKSKRSEFTVGYLGGISAAKNVLFVLKTAHSMKGEKGFKFRLYGEGAESERLAHYKRSNGLENLSLMGFVEDSRLMQAYDSFDAFIYPSLKQGPNLPVLDALARGLPVIVCRGNDLDKEVAKYCITADSERDAAKILMDLRERGYSAETRDRARAFAKRQSWEGVCRDTLSAYAQLLK